MENQQPTTSGRRYNAGKPRYSLIPYYVIQDILLFLKNERKLVPLGYGVLEAAELHVGYFLDEGDRADLYRAAACTCLAYNNKAVSLSIKECMEDLAHVYTRGADKYTDRDEHGNVTYDGTFNWSLGMSWLSVADSCLRHLHKAKTEQLDDESGQPHLMHALWNIITLLVYIDEHPEYDDRRVQFLPDNYGFDIDGVLADFGPHFLRYIHEHHDVEVPAFEEIPFWNSYIIRDNFHLVEDNEEFWMTVPVLLDPATIDVEPKAYITSRPVSATVCEQWLRANGFPAAPVINVLRPHPDTPYRSKSEACRALGLKLFFDDSFSNYQELRKAGIACMLVDRSHNRRFDVGLHRVYHHPTSGLVTHKPV